MQNKNDLDVWKAAAESLTPEQLCKLIEKEQSLPNRSFNSEVQFIGVDHIAARLFRDGPDAMQERLTAMGILPDAQLQLDNGYTQAAYRVSRLPYIRAMLICLPSICFRLRNMTSSNATL